MAVKKSVTKKEQPAIGKPETSRFVPPQVVVVEDEEITDVAGDSSNAEKENKISSDAKIETTIVDNLLNSDTENNAEDMDSEVIDKSEQKVQVKNEPITQENSHSEENIEHSALDRQKEVVKELFKKKETLLDSEISRHEKHGSAPLVMWVVIVLTVAFLVSFGIIFTFRGGTPTFSLPSQASPTPTIEPTVAVTPTPSVSKKELKIQVLNGNGEKGVAGTMKTVLEDLGYTVSDTGNAGTYDYENTEITVKSGKESIAEMLKTDLSEKYSAILSDKTLDASSAYDVRVIVGKK